MASTRANAMPKVVNVFMRLIRIDPRIADEKNPICARKWETSTQKRMFNTSATLFRLAFNRKSISRSFRTTTVIESEVKTPVQKIGWEYLLKQRAKNRPISPHFSVYTPPLTMILSGFHRISGCVMAGTLLVGGIGFAVLPFDFTAFVEFIRSWNLPVPIVVAFKFIIAFPIIFHTLNGIRFIAFDLAKGVDNIGQVYTSGRLVLVASAVIALAVVVNSYHNKTSKL